MLSASRKPLSGSVMCVVDCPGADGVDEASGVCTASCVEKSRDRSALKSAGRMSSARPVAAAMAESMIFSSAARLAASRS
jgi:hypothetical protein